MQLFALCAVKGHYIMDGLALLIMLIFACVYTRRGFVACLFGFLSTVIAVIVAFVFMNAVLRWTDGLFGLQSIIQRFASDGLSKITGFNVDISTPGLTETLSGKLPAFLIKLVAESVGNPDVPAGTTVAMIVGSKIGSFAVTLLAFFALFLLTKLVLKLFERVLTSLIQSVSILGTLNGVLGFFAGALNGLLLVCGVIAVVALIPSQGIAAFFNECTLLKWLYNNNPIHVIFGWFIKS